MRSRKRGTHNLYTDPTLLDVAGALAAPPELDPQECTDREGHSHRGA
ncbi:MAG: hypothetical protein PVJ27_04370 [Candidatus Brocadiaceae bacterium]|jgi:hypothetical protein